LTEYWKYTLVWKEGTGSEEHAGEERVDVEKARKWFSLPTPLPLGFLFPPLSKRLSNIAYRLKKNFWLASDEANSARSSGPIWKKVKKKQPRKTFRAIEKK
jgi:hypothetical protein